MVVGDYVVLGMIIGIFLLYRIWRGRSDRQAGLRMPTPRLEAVREIIEQQGFKVRGIPEEITVSVDTDQTQAKSKVKAELIAAKAGRRYIVKVKGKTWPRRLSSRLARSAILDLQWIYAVHGVILVDLEKRSAVEVRVKRPLPMRQTIVFAAGAAAVFAAGWLIAKWPVFPR